jgi:hypothetical protein
MPCAAYETAFETSEGRRLERPALGVVVCYLLFARYLRAMSARLSRPRCYRPSLLHRSFRATLNARIFHDADSSPADGMNSGAARFLCMDGR